MRDHPVASQVDPAILNFVYYNLTEKYLLFMESGEGKKQTKILKRQLAVGISIMVNCITPHETHRNVHRPREMQ